MGPRGLRDGQLRSLAPRRQQELVDSEIPQCHQQYHDDQPVHASRCLRRDGVVERYIGIALDAFRRELEYPGEVSLTQRLKEDLKLDSMAMIVVAVGLENAFRVKLQEEDAGAIATVGDLIALVVRRIGEAPPA